MDQNQPHPIRNKHRVLNCRPLLHTHVIVKWGTAAVIMSSSSLFST